DFEPLDLGRCGEPYTIWLVCGKTFGLWAHGVAGSGIAGEIRPPKPWNDIEGVEFGSRLEWRWDRFSFQLSHFYGYDDAPVIDSFAEFSRRVDPLTGMPLDARGRPLTPDMDPDHILRMHPGNRQLFDVVCSATVGIAAEVLEELTEDCLVDLLNSETEILLPGVTPANALGAVFTGTDVGSAIAGFIAGGGLAGSPIPLIELNHDPNDGGTAGTGVLLSNPLGYYLTDQQEALLGCGPFYGLDCDEDGID